MKTILVKNENVKAIASNDADKSVFEKYDYDIQIKNDGTLDELQQVATDFVQDLWKKEIKNVYEKPKFVPTMLNGDIVMLNDFFKVKETIDFANKENLDVVIQDSTVSTFPEAVVLLTQKGYKCKTC